MTNLATYVSHWVLDYAYVARQEILSIFSRSSSTQYQNPGAQPVLLIPGVYENWRFMRPIAAMLYRHGYDVHVVEKLGFNQGSIEDMAEIVSSYVSQQHLQHVIIVSHSKGGLIGKYLLSTAIDPDTYSQLIALNAPFSGSKYAYALPLRSLRIFIPHSKILTQLALDTISNTRVTSIYGLFDPHIPGGSKLEGAHNIQLHTYGHFKVLSNASVHKAIMSVMKTV